METNIITEKITTNPGVSEVVLYTLSFSVFSSCCYITLPPHCSASQVWTSDYFSSEAVKLLRPCRLTICIKEERQHALTIGCFSWETVPCVLAFTRSTWLWPNVWICVIRLDVGGETGRLSQDQLINPPCTCHYYYDSSTGWLSFSEVC